ncbi:Hypothetical predicted protein [Podarcis lilfordi]|uniref:Uncharacterized protein n=1 Tax=Podarcis lilfordi TaxID=74358 RepID=A0AA35PHP1_9SAUR|nr:Hypothetical predicted protein [Podarcis lilfordi]
MGEREAVLAGAAGGAWEEACKKGVVPGANGEKDRSVFSNWLQKGFPKLNVAGKDFAQVERAAWLSKGLWFTFLFFLLPAAILQYRSQTVLSLRELQSINWQIASRI